MRKNRAPLSCLRLPFVVLLASLPLCPNVFAQQAPDTVPATADSVLLVASPALAAESSSLPDAPDALAAPDPEGQAAQQPGASQHQDPQQKRIFGIMPNFRAVTAGTVLPRQSIRDKFVTASEDSFDYSSFILAGLVATEAYFADDTPEFGKGGVGFGRYYWHSFVDQTSENYFVEFIVPSITHEDTRFYSLGKGGFGKRFVYAVSRTFITRSDTGHSTFNSGEVVGAAISSSISNLYYPSPERTIGNTVDKYGVNLGIDMISFVVKEFYPDIYHAIFHQRIDTGTPAPGTASRP